MKKVIIPTMLALGLIIGSCNSNNRTREHKERSNENKTEIKDRTKNDSLSTKRDKTIRYDDQGNVKKEVKKESTERD
jgi:hypothetical protein